MKEKINKLIERVEEENDVKILFAVESGSRSWGFPSKDSDYDIRCVHVSPTKKYLSLNPPQEQITETEGKLDFVSWDIRKFVKLLIKSNPSTIEWLSSKIIYRDNLIRKRLCNSMQYGYSISDLKRHYISMARSNYEKYIRNKEICNLKKYLYVLRAITNFLWLEKYNKLPPIEYKESIVVLRPDVYSFFESIVCNKLKSENKEDKANKEVNEYIEGFFKTEYEKTNHYFPISFLDNYVYHIIKSHDISIIKSMG